MCAYSDQCRSALFAAWHLSAETHRWERISPANFLRIGSIACDRRLTRAEGRVYFSESPRLCRLLTETLMRACSTLIVGAAIGLAAHMAVIPYANADPAYSADGVIKFFAGHKQKTRSLCVGTAEDCKKQEAAAAPSSAQAHFDLLVNFAFDFGPADAPCEGKSRPVRCRAQRSATQWREVRNRRAHRRRRK